MNNISIILVGTQGPANIGAAARAMKNFGLTDLRLVSPECRITKESDNWAVNAKDVLEKARVFRTLEEALEDTVASLSFTRRIGKLRRERMTVAESARWLSRRMKKGRVALVFGREDSGLTSAEIAATAGIVRIPSHRSLPSLNLAQSVLIACYELFMRSKDAFVDAPRQEFVTKRAVAKLLMGINEALRSLGYEDTGGSPVLSKINDRLGGIFSRAGLTRRDVRMFEGLVGQVKKMF